MRHLIMVAALSTFVAQAAWSAEFTIEGPSSAVTLAANGASRSDIVDALAKKFKIEIVGGEVQAGTIEGRYSGTLGQVLKSILPENGYALAYRDGQPSRITFAGSNGSEVAKNQNPVIAAPVPQRQTEASAAGQGQASQKPTLEARMQREALNQVAPSAAPAEATPKSEPEQMKDMTARAIEDLRELARQIQQIK